MRMLGALLALAVFESGAAAQCPPSYLRSWGSNGVLNGQFRLPNGIAVDGAGNVFVADHELRVVKKFDSQGNFLLSWRTYGTPPAQPQGPHDVAVSPDGSIVYVSLQGSQQVQKFSPTGTRLGGVGPVQEATGLAVDSDGSLYVADNGSGVVTKFAADGTAIPGWVLDPPNCAWVVDVAVDPLRNVYVSEYSCNRISKYGPDRQLLAQWGSRGTGDGQFEIPRALTVDASGNVYVSDWYNNRVQKFTSEGSFLCAFGHSGSAVGEFGYLSPMNLAMGPTGDLFICDRGNYRIQVFGALPVPAVATSWGKLKAAYR